MSRTRQNIARGRGPDGSVLVRTHPVTYLSGHRSEAHAHDWDQLTYASDGVMTVHTVAGIWVVPPHRAVWVPAGVQHAEEMSGPVVARSLYFVPGLSKSLPRTCTTVNVPPLLRELILSAVRLAVLDCKIPVQARLIGVILDQLEALPAIPLQLPAPSDPRARSAAALLRDDSSQTWSLARIAREAGASKRTIERLFRAETGMSFRQWRQQQRLIEALRLLAAGHSVTTVALECGYASTSAFIAMFRRQLGTTPHRIWKLESA